MRIRIRVGLLVAGLGLMATAPVAAQAKLPAGVTPAMVAKGKTIFTSSGLCFACHGMDAKGVVGPNLTDDTWIHLRNDNYEGLITLITKGIPAAETKTGKGPMPPKGGAQLTDDDVKAVAAYVWSLSQPS